MDPLDTLYQFTTFHQTSCTVHHVGVMHIDLPDQLHRDAKAAAAQQGETLRALVTRAVEREIERLQGEQARRRR